MDDCTLYKSWWAFRWSPVRPHQRSETCWPKQTACSHLRRPWGPRFCFVGAARKCWYVSNNTPNGKRKAWPLSAFSLFTKLSCALKARWGWGQGRCRSQHFTWHFSGFPEFGENRNPSTYIALFRTTKRTGCWIPKLFECLADRWTLPVNPNVIS